MTVLRVATYNLYLGADVSMVFGVRSHEELLERARLLRDQLVRTDFPSRAAALAALLVRERIDLAGLQEVARWSRSRLDRDGRPGPAQVECDFLVELLAALERAGAPYDVHAVNPNFAGGAPVSATEAMSVLGHNVVLVRRGSGVRVLDEATGEFATVLSISTGLPDLTLQVRRGWGRVDAELDGVRFRFGNTHTEAYDAGVRDAQRDELLAAVATTADPLVLVGDFNASPAEVGMPADLVDAWAAAGDGSTGHTCGQAADLGNTVSALDQRIDYVWVRGAAVRSCRVVGHRPEDRVPDLGLWPSDHAGVVADVLLGGDR